MEHSSSVSDEILFSNRSWNINLLKWSVQPGCCSRQGSEILVCCSTMVKWVIYCFRAAPACHCLPPTHASLPPLSRRMLIFRLPSHASLFSSRLMLLFPLPPNASHPPPAPRLPLPSTNPHFALLFPALHLPFPSRYTLISPFFSRFSSPPFPFNLSPLSTTCPSPLTPHDPLPQNPIPHFPSPYAQCHLHPACRRRCIARLLGKCRPWLITPLNYCFPACVLRTPALP